MNKVQNSIENKDGLAMKDQLFDATKEIHSKKSQYNTQVNTDTKYFIDLVKNCKESDYDMTKICYKIVKQVNQRTKDITKQFFEKQKDLLKEGESQDKPKENEKQEDLTKEGLLQHKPNETYEDYISVEKTILYNSIINSYTNQINSINILDIEKTIFSILIVFLGFHKSVATTKFNYSVTPVLNLYSNRKSLSEIELFEQVSKYLEKILSHKKKDDEWRAAMMIMAYVHIQTQKFDESKVFLQELLEDLENFECKDRIIKKQKTNDSDNNEQLPSERDEQGLYESVLTYKALIYIFESNQKEQKVLIEELINLKNKDTNSIDKKRLGLHILLFQINLSYEEQDLKKAKETLGKFDEDQLEEDQLEDALLIYFTASNQLPFRNLDTIYYSIFGNNLYEIFRSLQDLQEKQPSSKEVDDLIMLLDQENKYFKYKFGKGVYLMLLQINSMVLRYNKKYEQAKNQIQFISKICQIKNTTLLEPLQFYFAYELMLSHLFSIIDNNTQNNDYTIVKRGWKSTGLSSLDLCYAKKDESQTEYVIKKVFKISNQFSFIREIAIQSVINHHSIQRIQDVFSQEKKIASVQLKQGENLRDVLKQDNVNQEIIMGYFLQVIHAMNYIQHLNITHQDLKLENIITHLNDITKIFIIDFGFGQVKLFNKFFDLTGQTVGNTPEECVRKKEISYLQEIQFLGKVLGRLLFFQPDDPQIYKEDFQKVYEKKSMFLISKELEQLKDQLLTNESKFNYYQIIRKFRLELFLYKIFIKIIEYRKVSENNEDKKQIFQQFSKKFQDYFKQFTSFVSKTNYIQQINWKGELLEFEGFSSNEINNAIYSFFQPDEKDQTFFDCLEDQDIRQLIYHIFPDKKSDLDMKFYLNTQKLAQLKQNQHKENLYLDETLKKLNVKSDYNVPKPKLIFQSIKNELTEIGNKLKNQRQNPVQINEIQVIHQIQNNNSIQVIEQGSLTSQTIQQLQQQQQSCDIQSRYNNYEQYSLTSQLIQQQQQQQQQSNSILSTISNQIYDSQMEGYKFQMKDYSSNSDMQVQNEEQNEEQIEEEIEEQNEQYNEEQNEEYNQEQDEEYNQEQNEEYNEYY